MAMPAPFAIVRTRDQWLRCRHQHTAYDETSECVELEWTSESHGVEGTPPAGVGAGLAFDRLCRLYHSVPEGGRIEWRHWQAQQTAETAIDETAMEDLFERPAPPEDGVFVSAHLPEGPLVDPRGLAADERDHLFVAEAGRNRLLIYDIDDRRLVRVIPLADLGAIGPRPIDVAACRSTAYVLTENPVRLLRLTAQGVLHYEQLPAQIGSPVRLAVSPRGRIALLDTAARRVIVLEPGVPARDIDANATDIEFETEDMLVVAFRPGQDFARVSLAVQPLTRPGLKARGYDGRGIVRTPDGRIGYWTVHGFRHAAPLRIRYEPAGTVATFRLDTQDWQTVWGRVYLDACAPEGTSIAVHSVASDEPPDETTLQRTPPANAAGASVEFPEASPPMPPVSFAPRDDERQSDFRPVFRRETGRELPWASEDLADGFVTFEAPVHAGAGRYLWVTIKLTGTTRVTPRVKCLRAEYPAHDYLRRLPRTLSRDEGVASFLRRYLAISEGFLRETDARAYERATLLDAWATPDEALPWLASFVGLLLDERWARAPRPGGRFRDVRRDLLAEVNSLFRFRGTECGLRRFLEIYLGAPVTILEHFRVRGLGGGLVGSTASSPTVESHAHRFSVIAHASLTEEQRAVIDHILDTHRPAHTVVELCTVGAGLRTGLGAHVGLSSIVGATGSFGTVRVGTVFGRDAILGRPPIG